MSSLLEKRYRLVLRMLPRSYRERREEEMVDTYLEEFDEDALDEVRPSLSEVASIAALAVRTRMGSAGAPARYAVAGATVRLFALLSILIHAGRLLTNNAITVAWMAGAPVEDRRMYLQSLDDFSLTGIIGSICQWVLPLGWVVAYAALVRDRRRAARVAAIVAAVPFVWTIVDPRWFGGLSGFDIATTAFAWLTALAVCCGFHDDAPATRLPLAPPGLALMTVCVLMGLWNVSMTPSVDFAGPEVSIWCVAGLLWCVARARREVAALEPPLSLALALVGVAVLAERMSQIGLIMDGGGLGEEPMPVMWGQTALAVLLVGFTGVSGALAARRVTREDPARETGSAVG